ncbi:AAEL007584-PA [Aedes aegypti]|uniref:AAEL007584-PA n=1 Tax=Aedes aegypti TaxID=7159 RepID=Q171N1_AEDAE|nr:AAEL007584-PA [Aedes aegypti]
MPWRMPAGILLLQLLMSLSGISYGRALNYLNNRQPKECVQLPAPVLSNILGPAYNSRYMSIDKPPVMDEVPAHGEMDGKRRAGIGLFPTFYVEDDFSEELGNSPAWAVDHVQDTANQVLKAPFNKREAFDSILHEMDTKTRSARNARRGQNGDGTSRPWECDAKIRWIDLGDEYYPRFLRTVECAKTRCWYGHYQCTPRSFTVKMLRKRTGQCVPADQLHKVGVDGLPGELSELWVWEERAVNFCCDCSPRF